MISPAINEIILRLFDHSAQGISILLENLKPLFLCESIQLSTSLNQHLAANDNFHNIEGSWYADEPILKQCHPAFKACDKQSKRLKMSIKPDDSLNLILQFPEHSALKKCLTSHDIKELIPHIQQAVLIAEQISQQLGDAEAIHYVIRHHPLLTRMLTQSSADGLIYQADPHNHITQASSLTFRVSEKSIAMASNNELNMDVNTDFLKQVYMLTPSEAELAKSIFKGLSLQEISEVRGVSKQTIRKQCQSVLKKAQCENQEALIIEIFNALFSRLDKPIKQ